MSDDTTSNSADNPLANATIDQLRSLGIISDSSQTNPQASSAAPDPSTNPNSYTMGPGPDPQAPSSQLSSPGFQPINPYTQSVAPSPPNSITSGPPGTVNPIQADQTQTSAGPSPVNPVLTPGTPTGQPLPNKLGDVNSATGALNNAETSEDTASKLAATNAYNADNAHNAKINTNNDNYINSLTENDRQHQIAREHAHQQAATDTANWMQSMDKQVAEKPSAGNWWHDQTGFGKALWLLGLAFGAKSQSLGGKNTVADMINQEIDNDMKRQQEVINKRGENLRNKGKVMLENQTQQLNDINDDYTHRVGRIGALMEANKVKAAQATTDDLKATYSKADAYLAGKKTEVAKDRYDNSVKERLNVVDQQYETGRESLKLTHETNEKVLDRQHQSSENALERQNKRDLAEEKVAGQLAAAEKKAQNKQDLHEFPIQSGVNLTEPDEQGRPKVTTFAVPKDQAEPASKIVQSNQAKIVALSKLRDELSKDGTPYGTFENSNEGRQRLASIVDPIVKQVGGRFSPDNAKLVTDMILGEDPSSIWQRAKGSSTKDIVKMLDREIQEAPGYFRQQLLGIPGSNLADHPNANLVVTAPDTTGPAEHEYTPDEKYESATGKPAASVRLDSPADIKDFGDDAVARMPSDLRKQLNQIKDKLGTGVEKPEVDSIKQEAHDAINKWSAKHPDDKTGTQSHNASVLVDEYTKKAEEVADRLPGIKLKLASEIGWTGPKTIDKAAVQEELTRAGLTIPDSRIKDIIKDIHDIRAGNPINQAMGFK